jgi:hypothetical protein
VLLVCWVAFPLLLLALCLGQGALVRVLSGRAFPPVLLVPVGLAASIVLASALTTLDLTAELAAPAMVLAAAAGIVLERAALLEALRSAGRWAPPSVAMLGAFAVLGAPVILSGAPTFTGYTAIVDIAHQLDFSAWLAEHGRARPASVDSSLEEVVEGLLVSGYPSGVQAVLGSLGALTTLELTWIYQPFVAFVGAATVPALYVLLERAVARRSLRALAASIAAQPTLLVSYALGGGIKEIAAVGTVALVAALLRGRPHSPRELLPVVVATIAGLAVLSLFVLPWLGVLVAGAALISAGGVRRAVRRRPALVVVVVALALAAPTALAATQAGPSVSRALAAAEAGNLAAPVSPWAASGVWLTGDHRFPLTARRLETGVGVALALALAALGVALAARRRDAPLLVLALAGAIGLAAVALVGNPWVDLKAFAITGTIVLTLAFAGAAGLLRSRLRPVAVALAAGLAALVLWGNALVYHDAMLAPYDRLRDLEAIAEDFAGAGPALYPGFEEHAEYLLRDLRAVSTTNPPDGDFGVLPAASAERTGQRVLDWDLDEYEPGYLQRFGLIVMRANPLRSRPPSNYRLVRRNRFHEVWRRGAQPQIIARLPLSAGADASDASECTRLASGARRRTDRRALYARVSELVSVGLAGATWSPNWAVEPAAGFILARGPGRLVARVDVPRGGRHSLWMAGSFGRRVSVTLDGRPLGALEGALNYPNQFERIGERALRPGVHELVVERAGGSLRPGTGDGAVPRALGPLLLMREPPASHVVHAAADRSPRALCARPERLDWLEVVR